jgi:protein-S-isoprenylcysteine O-methyltransferase Ste14
MQASSRILPLLCVLLFVGILLIQRGLRFHRRFGRSPFCFPNKDDVSAGAFLSRVLLLFLATMVTVAIVVAVKPEWVEHFDPLYRYHGLSTVFIGIVLISIGTVLVLRAQHDMGAAWRVGIDSAHSTELVTGGLFRFCRNPIYLGLQIALFGFLSLVPSCFMGTMLLLALLSFQVQARLEEAHLLSQHGEVYAEYCRQVGRFSLWTGRFYYPTADSKVERSQS